MDDFPEKLERIMEERNFRIIGKIDYSALGKWQRFRDANKSYKRDKPLFVIIRDDDKGASFGDHHYPDDWKSVWRNDNYKLTIEDRRHNERLRQEREIAQQYERSKRQWRAKEFFHKYYLTQDTESHPYVINKRIRAYYSKQVRSWLIIPVRDIDYNLMSVQIIKPNGFKRLWKGTSQKNNMIWLSEKLPDDYSGVIRICEGYATGCAIYEAIGAPVVCAINSNNMPGVTKLICEKFPKAILKLCGDNDQWGEENTGLIATLYANNVSGATIYYPTFERLDTSKKPTDFNDLMCLGGIEVVEKQLILIR